MRQTLVGMLIGIAAAAVSTAAAAERAGPLTVPGREIFAVVGETVIRGEEFDRAFHQAARQKFYHRRPPQGEVAALQREVGDRLIHRVLLLAEAQRRGLRPEKAKVERAIAEYDARYGESEHWKQNRERLVPGLRKQHGEQDVLERLEAAVRSGPPATEAQARRYYDRHREQFTEPEKVKLSAILLKVDPSSPQLAWDKAREEAQQIGKRLAAGADFAEMARLHSSDASAANGGDLGYLHRGMLQESMQNVVDALQPGTVSEPVLVLEGVALIRLEARQSAEPRAFADVKERAAALWERERSDTRWREFLAHLRKATTVRVDEARYPPEPAGGEPGARARDPSGAARHARGEKGA